MSMNGCDARLMDGQDCMCICGVVFFGAVAFSGKNFPAIERTPAAAQSEPSERI